MPSVPDNSPAFPDDLDPDPFGLAHAAMDADAKELGPSSTDAHERGGALPVVGAAPALAERTAGVEPAGEAETATTAKLEALAPWAQGMAGREVEKLPQKCTLDAPSRVDPKGVAGRMHEALPPEAERESSGPPRKLSREDITKSKRPVEAMDTTLGIDARITRSQRPCPCKSVRQHHHEGSTTHLGPSTFSSSYIKEPACPS